MKQIIILITIIIWAMVVPAVTVAQHSSRPTLSRAVETHFETRYGEQTTTKTLQGKTEQADAVLSLLWASVALAVVWFGGRKDLGGSTFASNPDRYRNPGLPNRRLDSQVFSWEPGFGAQSSRYPEA